MMQLDPVMRLSETHKPASSGHDTLRFGPSLLSPKEGRLSLALIFFNASPTSLKSVEWLRSCPAHT